ncbi:hypothetical protein B23_1769 [Geobacillus thermoleovorans B23]|nr:hypothetical protein B23_1769 [Geobacillus thermoleovorans B23]
MTASSQKRPNGQETTLAFQKKLFAAERMSA